MTATLALSAEERALVCEILRRHLPAGVAVHVFGSRAHGTPKSWSDLDLVLTGNGPLPLDVLAILREAFDESALPWKVDIVDRDGVDEVFGQIIDEAAVPLF